MKSFRDLLPVMILAFLFSLLMQPAAHAGPDDISSVRVGDFEVHMLSERQRESDTSILIGASEADIKKFIPSGKYPSAVNAFLVRTPEALFLIDTGFGEKLFDNMAQLGVQAEDVDYLLITHSHGDHIGGMVKDGRAAFPKATVYVSQKEAEWSAPLKEKLALYTGKVELFTPAALETGGSAIFKGVNAIAAYGHTPGHTMFLLESRGERFLIWGDLTHAMAIQIPLPAVSVTYDSDPREAAVTRQSVLRYVSENKITVGGMHIAYPGYGKAEKDASGEGEYKFTY